MPAQSHLRFQKASLREAVRVAHRATATVEPLQSAPSADLVRDLKIMPADRKQNLILFLPDQQRADTLACYGGVKVHAPNLNKLASESVIFERAYVTHPVCTPSRSSLMTGTWPHINGCTRNSVPLDRRFLVFPELMKDKDYRTAYMGKWHLGEDGPAGRGFQQWISTDDHGDYTNFITDAGVKPDKPNGRFSELAISDLPLELSRPKFLEKHACEFIERRQRDPFILVVGFVEPHSPYNGPLNNEHPLDEVDLDLTATLSESENIPLRYRLMREWQQAEAILDRERLPTQLFFGITPDEYRSIKQRYLGLVTLVDQNIDFVPTLLDLLQQPTHPQCAGKSLLPVINQEAVAAGVSPASPHPGNVFIEWAPNRTKIKKGSKLARRRTIKRAVEESTRTVVSPDGWKLCLRDKDSNELYNLKDDPFETRNLYSDRQYASVISRLAGEIHHWQEFTNDKLKL